jgi:tRNA 5-methylaminomethyl-2-thiouridine biosynthesis bifunctional protein
MPAPLQPATLAFLADGTPCSAAYDDVYHSSGGGLQQARHVFLGGNGLPARWAGRPHFTILETGFGTGLGFLATWQAWREDPARPARLHFVSVEKHPFTAADLARIHAVHPALAPLAAQLQAAWPLLVGGFHRLEFEAGRLVLTLAFADIAQALPQMRLAADALYLDGFAPAKNPEMWTPAVLKALARLALPGATLATYTAANAVRETLAHAGWSVAKQPGFADKRDMLCATRQADTHAALARPAPQRSALVIGAGLAGAAVCERLAARGWSLTVLERHPAPAMEGSGNHAGAFHPVVTRDDSILARLTRAAYLDALQRWPRLAGLAWARCGVLQMGRNEEELDAQREAMQRLAYPAQYARWMDRAEASARLGREAAAGGLWFEHSGWLRPPSLVAALLEAARTAPGARTTLHLGAEVATLARVAGQWRALDATGRVLGEAAHVVLANAAGAAHLAALPHVALRSVRGQLSYLPAAGLGGGAIAPGFVLLRGGSLLPAVEGIAVAGASYDIDDADLSVRADSHAGNLERLARILPGAQAGLDPHALQGRAALRCVAADRLPLVGTLPGAEGLHTALAYASRGILWCQLMGELLASQLEGEPLPVEAQLADAVDPGRFQRRALRRAGGR